MAGWPVLGALILSLVAFPGTRAAAEPESRPSDLYRKVLESYALGDTEAALLSLVDLQSPVAGDRARGGHVELHKVQLGVVRDTLRVPRDLLIPIIVFHEHAYLTYLERDLPAQAYGSRATVFHLTELYAQLAFENSARRIASDLFASLAGYFRADSVGPAGFELYDRSLELHRSNEVALLGLAVAHEQQGRHRRALPYLRRLVAAHPESSEGRLRLALNLDRIGQPEDAVVHLRHLIEQEPPEWILSLAYQELARVLHRQGESEQARLLLGRASERLPPDPTLTIALAYFNELQGVGGELDLAEALRRCVGAAGPQPRFGYSRGSSAELDRLRRRLRAEAERRRPELARLLFSRPPDPG